MNAMSLPQVGWLVKVSNGLGCRRYGLIKEIVPGKSLTLEYGTGEVETLIWRREVKEITVLSQG